MLFLFVYGTLKRGQRSHQRFCSAAIRIESGWTWGRLYDLPQGYPTLQVPREAVLGVGTSDVAADIAKLSELSASPAAFDTSSWRRIEGDWITLPAEAALLRALDDWEGFRPSGNRLYDRVVLRIYLQDGTQQLAWTYVAPDGNLPPGAVDCGERWPT